MATETGSTTCVDILATSSDLRTQTSNQQGDGFLQSRQMYRKHRHEDTEDELNNLFNKKFRYRFNDSWKLPDRGCWFTADTWVVKELDSLKSRLNFHKSQLNDFNIEEWSNHTRRRNPAGEVCWKLKCLVNPEFLTQAWTKFYECAFNFEIIPPQVITSRKFVSLHLCEAPGAFIASLNHFLQSYYPDTEWHWVASTLNPYYEGNSPSNMISDDRFMFHTMEHWDFGLDNTGNLMNWANSQAIVQKAQALGKVMLVTADGSIDCLERPDAQEEVTSPLHYCEIVTGLQALSEGGTLIFKLFTIFEHSTVCLMYLINHLFEEVNIYKPVTSRQGNSEVYAICLKYRRREIIEPYMDILKTAYGTETYKEFSMFPLTTIPPDFLEQIQDCAYYFSSIQCQVINNNLQAYLMNNQFLDVKRIRNIVAAEFIRMYELRALTYDKEILKGILHEESKINTNPRYHKGSYTDRQLYQTLDLKGKAKNLKLLLKSDFFENSRIYINEDVRWIQMYDGTFDVPIVYTFGKPLEKINSSKFIFVPIFKLYQQILAEDGFKDILLHKETICKTVDLGFLEKELTFSKSIDFPEYDYSEPYSVFEKRCLKLLLEFLNNLNIGESLLLQNFNTLTHFNVNILFILCKKCFESAGFTKCNAIVLSNLINKSALDLLETIKNVCVKSTPVKDVLSVLPVQIVYTDVYFNTIVFYNNTLYTNKCLEYLNVIEGVV